MPVSYTPLWAYVVMGVLSALALMFCLLYAFKVFSGKSEVVPKDGTVLINYWDHSSARATAVLHVLAAGKGKYKHKELTAKSIVDQTLATVHPSGGTSWMDDEAKAERAAEIAKGKVALQMSPPVLIDQTESKEFTISQTAAILNYLGRKYNMYPDDQAHNHARAEQYILDQQDFFGSMTGKGRAPKKSHAEWLISRASESDPSKQTKLLEFVRKDEHGKLHLWLGTINRQIKGPFYFGEKPTYVDFALMGVLSAFTDYHRETIKVLGKDPVEEYAKVAKIRKELKKGRDGYSYAKVQKLCNGLRWKEAYIVQPETAKAATNA
jgi:glutathione S-transferase